MTAQVESLAPRVAAPATRNATIDHIRILLTALVIFHHVAIAYGGSGGWYWREQPNASNKLLVIFNATNQSYFMGFFFLLAGYFTPPSYDKKGPKRYIVERLLRLGVPLLAYFFVLSPLTIALARTSRGFAFWPGWWQMTLAGKFSPGPLWFAEALLLFAAGYLLWRKFRPTSTGDAEIPSFKTLMVTALILGIVSFLVRFAVPVGKEVAWLQLGYFPCYIYLFAAGCATSRSRVLERVAFHQARPWLIVSILALLSLPSIIVFNLGQGHFEGGWSNHAIYYALWDPFVAWGVILGLLWVAHAYFSQPTFLTRGLAGSAYGAFIVHPPIAVGAGLMAATWPFNPLVKFLLVGTIACFGSFSIASLLGAIPGFRKVL